MMARMESSSRNSRSCLDRKSTRLNSSHLVISYAVFCLKKKTRRVRNSWRHNSHLVNLSHLAPSQSRGGQAMLPCRYCTNVGARQCARVIVDVEYSHAAG